MVHLDTSGLTCSGGGELVLGNQDTNEGSVVCIVRNTLPTNDVTGPGKLSIMVRPSYPVKQLMDDVATQFHCSSGFFELVLQATKEGDSIVLNNLQDKTCGEVGLNFNTGARNTLIVGPLRNRTRRKALFEEDDLVLGASASSTTPLSDASPPVLNKEPVGFVGLVNQAMTCYLNSLLQALYMTPEFRNALYNWQFDGKGESKSIPFQLQQLFLQLQTSHRAAIETTDLTRSFGWDSTEAWQQHDVQELCRVMFDALEQKFRRTEQADLINRLYQGKMIDYVRCLRCNTEKIREDTFLDIPLPVRPFGSTVAYNSIEDALRAFVQPETLDGNNQYHCEKCNQKCDAHKGLKFKHFPYLLTLHLKRFDFDYQTLHRIKLNDKVTFPETLNLNGFVGTSDAPSVYVSPGLTSEDVSQGLPPCDDSSTTDSGSALDYDKEIPSATGAGSDSQEYDEGIDMSMNNGIASSDGCYNYELFSIMIHSGSASGGHYYAYIKDFKSGHWFCFNDQSVTLITEDDIHKSYGGGPSKGYYSGAYSSSTNAYMLMYRQVDPQRNTLPMDPKDFPDHIKELLQRCQEREDNEKKKRELESGMCKIRLYARDLATGELLERRMFVYRDVSLAEVTQDALQRLQWTGGVVNLNPDDCRLVMYDQAADSIDYSLEDMEGSTIGEIIEAHKSTCCDMFLEVREKPGVEFKRYEPGGINVKVFIVNIETEDVNGPVMVRGNASQSILDFKQQLVTELQLQLSPEQLHIGSDKYYNGPKLLEDNAKLKNECLPGQNKFFISATLDSDRQKTFASSKLKRIIDRFEYIIILNITLPVIDKETMEGFPTSSVDTNQNSASPLKPSFNNSNDAVSNSNLISNSPVPPALEGENSEDSSLSESDRTLVGDIPTEMDIQESDKPECWDDECVTNLPQPNVHYFKSTPYKEGPRNMLRVLVDKRMVIGSLKQCLSETIGVPVDYFKLLRTYTTRQECECTRYNESVGTLRDDENLIIRLGRTLRPGEHRGKIFLLRENDPEYAPFLCEWILSANQTVAQFKAELLKAHPELGTPHERWRVRKKNWKNPAKIYLDNMNFSDDITLFSNWELFLQDLAPSFKTDQNEGQKDKNGLDSESNSPVTFEPKSSADQLVLFVKRWRPSLLKLEPFQEVILDGMSTDELKQKLHNISGIPLNDIEFAKAPNTFPCETSVLTIHGDQDWNPQATSLDAYPLHVYEDGNVFYYRDKKEELREINAEEKREILAKEGHKFGRQTSLTSGQSHRRERALKIYLDNSPKKKDLVD